MLSLLRSSKTATTAALAVAGLAVGACSDASTSPSAAAPRTTQYQASAVRASVSSSSDSYLACPSKQTFSATKIIGPRGGILAVNGSAMAVPPGAVPSPTRFTFTVPASDIMQIEVHAEGVDHYLFQRPVMMTIDYSRCASAVDHLGAFSAWYIDTPTRNALSWMGGVDDRLSHRVFFATGHLSGYAVSERKGAASDDNMQ